MRVEFLLQRVTRMIVLTKTYLNEGVGVVIHESLIYSEVYLTQRFLLHSWPLRNVMLKEISLACVPHTANECKCQKLHTK